MKKFIDISQFILVLTGFAIIGLFATASTALLPLHGNALKWTIFSAQNILAFIIPSILMWKICFRQPPLPVMEADKFPSLKMIGIALAIYLTGMPLLNQIVYWNQEMQLPEFMSGFEEWSREMERMAEDQTKDLLNTTGILSVTVNILTIGVLTGIGEEFFFRGALQRGLEWCGVNVHTAIWTSAFIFSAIHFQFYGFVPRLLLGALFGYLYFWSGNIWVNSFAHALNNSLVIISAWCINKGFLTEDFDMMGVAEGGLPVASLISAAVVTALIIIFHNRGYLGSHARMMSGSNSKSI